MAHVACLTFFPKTLLLLHEVETVCYRRKTLSFYAICSSRKTFVLLGEFSNFFGTENFQST